MTKPLSLLAVLAITFATTNISHAASPHDMHGQLHGSKSALTEAGNDAFGTLQNSYNNETLKDIIFQERLSKPYKRHDKTPYEPSRSEMIDFISQQLTWTPSYRDSFSIIEYLEHAYPI